MENQSENFSPRSNILLRKSVSPAHLEKAPVAVDPQFSIEKITTDTCALSLEPLSIRPPNAEESLATEPVSEAKPQAKCFYCDKAFDDDALAAHQDACDKKQIQCEACEEMVELDIFDFHLEICSARVNQYQGYYYGGNGTYFVHEDAHYGQPQAQGQVHQEHVPEGEVDENEEGVQENQEENQENAPEEGEIEEEDDGEGPTLEELLGFDPSVMTYEQLIQLDNTIVKKGLNEEEMKQFSTEVYMKAFDGPGSCNICISELESGDFLRKLTCGHKFHKECIDTWLSENITCPICKKYFR